MSTTRWRALRRTTSTGRGGGRERQPVLTFNDLLFFRKNNLAAKKSRDARRVRENQLRLRVLCLENANRVLREQMDRKDVELAQLRYNSFIIR